MSDLVPAASDEAVVPCAVPPAPPRIAWDWVRDISRAADAVRWVSAAAGGVEDRDVQVAALTALQCVGATPAAALEMAAACAREAVGLEVHALAWARIPGADEGMWEYHVTMTVSGRDADAGDLDGPTQVAGR